MTNDSESPLDASGSSVARSIVPAIIGGLSIGWLVGLSSSPVVSIVITSAVGALVAAVSARGKRAESNLWPLVVVALAIAVAAPPAVYVREHNLLGLSLEQRSKSAETAQKAELEARIAARERELEATIAFWSKQGLEPKRVSEALFAKMVPLALSDPATLTAEGASTAGLYAKRAKVCAPVDLIRGSEEDIKRALDQSSSPVLRALGSVSDAALRKAAVMEYCR